MRSLLLIAVLVAAGCGAAAPPELLWSGSRYTRAERDEAVMRGLAQIYRLAQEDAFFDETVGDFLWCYYSIVATTPDPALRAHARERGRALAQRWKDGVRGLPHGGGIGVVWDLASTLDVAEELGVEYPELRRQLEPAVARYSAERWLDFDPRTASPPTRKIRLEGDEACAAIGKNGGACAPVEVVIPDLDIFYDAMITTYFGDRFGVTHGATFAEFIRWLPQLYPYATRDMWGDDAFYDLIYIVTHVVYTHNDYGVRALNPVDLPEELAFLNAHFDVPYGDDDCETYAEFVDTKKSFGIRPEDDPDMALAIESLMTLQNPDGSWGDPHQAQLYDIFHTTWTAIEALRDYEFSGA